MQGTIKPGMPNARAGTESQKEQAEPYRIFMQ